MPQAKGEPRGAWSPLAFDGSKGFKGSAARSVAFVQDDASGACCVAVGGDDGSLHLRWLADDGDGDGDGDGGAAAVAGGDAFASGRPPQTLQPSHGGAVVALRGRDTSGLLVSGARDGTMRVWDLSAAAAAGKGSDDGGGDGDGDGGGGGGGAAKCLYGLGGYKVWLGSICTDGRRLVSDGSDNTVVVHDFGGEPNS